jgi:hypothetical protein
MQQSVAVFTNAAARTAAITSPVEGQLTYLEDTNLYGYWNGSSWVSPFGTTLLANQSFTSSNAITVNNVFSSQFDSYRILMSTTAGGGYRPTIQFSVGGSLTTSNYNWQRLESFGAATTSTGATSQSSGELGRLDSTGFLDLIVNNPAKTSATYGLAKTFDTALVLDVNAFNQTSSTAFDGFTILGSSSTGTIQVYGFRN